MPCILPLTLILIFLGSQPSLTYLQDGSAAVAVAVTTAAREASRQCVDTLS